MTRPAEYRPWPAPWPDNPWLTEPDEFDLDVRWGELDRGAADFGYLPTAREQPGETCDTHAATCPATCHGTCPATCAATCAATCHSTCAETCRATCAEFDTCGPTCAGTHCFTCRSGCRTP
jgi:hypothetical protein